MRKIKFRIWDKFLYHMYYDEDNKEEPNLWNIKEHVSGGKLIDTKSSVLMQYTGLKDKNGKEIYEGDILRGPKKFRAEVIFEDGAFTVRKNLLYFQRKPMDLEVIGNIYENPELLEAKWNLKTRNLAVKHIR